MTLVPAVQTASKPDRSFSAMPAALKAYLLGLFVAGGACVVLSLRHPVGDVQAFIALLVASAVTAAVKVSLPLTQGGSTLSLSYVVNFAAVLVLGPLGTVPIALASGWSQCTFKMREPNPWHQTVFSMAALTVTVVAAGATYVGVRDAFPGLLPAQFGAAILAATVYFLFNSLLVAGAISLASRQNPLAVWKHNFLWSSPTYYMGALVAFLAVVVTHHGGAVWVAILSVPAYVTYRSYRAYSERITEEQRQVREASELQIAVIESLALAIEAKDRTAHGHLNRMQTYSEGLARAAGMSDAEVRGVRTAALLHDIGNLAVPEHILSKPGPLTHAEFERLKVHPKVGADILKAVPFPYPVASLVLAHHERWDGRGYPAGLKGSEIPLGARILAVVDCFTAMLDERPYRPARTYAEAIATLRENGGSALDPTLVAQFVEVLPTLESQRFGSDASAADGHPRESAASHTEQSALDHIAVTHREEHVLHEVAQTLSSTLRISDVVALISSRLVNLVPFSSTALFLFDEASELYLCQYAAGTHQEAVRAVTASTIEGLEKALPQMAGRGMGAGRLPSVLVASLQHNQRAMGALVFYHTEVGAYTADHRRLIAQIAKQAAPVVANAVVFERAQEQSLTDVLTGLPNRRSMERHFGQELARAHRHRRQVSLLLLDMDRFKEINDEFGHQAGDRALREVAQVLRTALREYDLCARYAGDEFVVVLGDCDHTQAERRRREVQEAVAALDFEPAPGHHVRLGVSAGAATFPHDGAAADDLVAAADRRMYQDKAGRKAGRGTAADTPRW